MLTSTTAWMVVWAHIIPYITAPSYVARFSSRVTIVLAASYKSHKKRTIINLSMSLFCLNSHDIALKMDNNKQNMLLKMFSMLFSYCNLWRDSRYYTRVFIENKTIVVTLMTINKVNGIENAFLLELNELFWMFNFSLAVCTV